MTIDGLSGTPRMENWVMSEALGASDGNPVTLTLYIPGVRSLMSIE